MKNQTLINNLNTVTANEHSAMTQFITDIDQPLGDYRPQLADYFLAGVANEKQHARLLETERILRDWPI